MILQRNIAILLVLALLLGTLPAIFADGSFTDVSDTAWYAEAVSYCADHSLMNGVGNHCFDPEGKVTREMVVQTFYNIEGDPECEEDSGFTDLESGAWYVPAVNWAAQKGIAGGYPDGTFGVGQTVTREEFAAFLHRYAKTVGMNDVGGGNISIFPDGDTTSDWAQTDVIWALGAGFLQGVGQKDGSVLLCPQGTVTRAQLATVLMRFYEAMTESEEDFDFEELPDGTLQVVKYRGKNENPQIPTEVDGKKVTAIGEAAFQGSLTIKTLAIPEGITEIGDYAFECCARLTSVSFPSTLRKVGMGAFSGCVMLKSVSVSEGITEFGDGAFYFCRRLAGFAFPKSVTHVGDYMFAECTSLKEVTFEEGLTQISERMFWKCDQLQRVLLPQSLTAIGDLAFSRCEMLSECLIPAGVTSIGAYAFRSCGSLTSVTFPADTVKEYTFCGCYCMEEVTLSDQVTTIEPYAFSGAASTEELVIPASVTEIAPNAFNGMRTPGFAVDENNPNFTDVDGVLMSKDQTTLLAYPAGRMDESYAIPEMVSTIGSGAFSGVAMLSSLTIPASVKTLQDQAFFELCNLPELIIPETVESMGEAVFESMNAQVTLNCPIKVLPKDTFRNSNTEKVILPDTLEEIGEDAFYCCGNLAELTLPKNLKTIAPGAFAATECAIKSDSPDFTVTDGMLCTADGKTLVRWQRSADVTALTIPDGVQTVAPFAIDSRNLTSVFVPDTLKTVGEYGIGYQFFSSGSEIEIKPVTTLKIFGSAENCARDYALQNCIGYFTAEPKANLTEITLAGDETAVFTVENAQPEDVFYSSFDSDIVSVTQDGTITAHKKGVAEIYANVGTTYFKCTVTVTSDGTPNEAAFDAGKYRDLARDEVPAWLENYLKVNENNITTEPELNAYSAAYKGENYFEGIWAAQVEESEYDAGAVGMFDVNFRPQMRMMGHGLATELSRYEQTDDLVLYSGTVSFARFLGGSATMKDLKNSIGMAITEPFFLSTALQESVTPTFAGPYNSVFIIYADRELIDGGYIEGTVGQGAGGEYELLLKGGTRMEIIDAGLREISVEDPWTGEISILPETYVKVRLLPKE